MLPCRSDYNFAACPGFGWAAFYNMLTHKDMKKIFLLLPLAAVVLVSCQPPMPAVPPSNRTVVGPKGSSDAVKPWNNTTRKEGEAVLGPLGDMNRR